MDVIGVWRGLINKGCVFGELLTWRPIEQATFRGDDPHSLEELRVGQRQLNHLPQKNNIFNEKEGKKKGLACVT